MGLLSCLIASIFPLPRILYAMAEDGLIFSFFGNVHPRFKTPTVGILVSGFVTAIIAAIFDVDQMVDMISIGTVRNISIVDIKFNVFNISVDGLHYCRDLCYYAKI